MGNYLTAPIKDLLKKYTYNFQDQQVKLDLMNTNFEITNLILNEKAINFELEKKNLPFKIKFGVLKKFRLKISLFGGKLERMIIDSFILILGPNENYASSKFMGLEEEKMYTTCIKNMEASKKGLKNYKYLNHDIFFAKENEEYKKKVEEEKAPKKPEPVKKEEKQGVNVMGIEIFEIIKNFLNCVIDIENIYIIYEDSQGFLKKNYEKENFIVTFQFKDFKFEMNDVKKNTNKDGYFKNFFNIASFLQKSGTWDASDIACWNIVAESFKISFSVGNEWFIVRPLESSMLTQNNVLSIISKFFDNYKNNRLNNSFDLLSVNKINSDVLVFYRENAQVPIHGLFLNFDFTTIDFNLELSKMELLLELKSYVEKGKQANRFELLKPRFKILTSGEYNKLCTKMKLNLEEKKNLKQLNTWVIREYFKFVVYLSRYESYIAQKIPPQDAYLLVLKEFVNESKIYKTIFGDSYPRYFQEVDLDKLRNNVKEVKVEKKENVMEPEELMKDTKITILNKIHIHFRFLVNLKLNILNTRTNLPENVLEINGFVIDVFKPVANLKIKAIVKLNRLSLTADKELYPKTKKQKMGIFGMFNQRENKTSTSIINNDEKDAILNFSNLMLSFDISVKLGKNNKFLYMIYSENVIGALTYNYFPNIFKKLIIKLIRLKQMNEKTLSYLLKGVKKLDKVVDVDGTRKLNAKQQKVVSKQFKNQAFENKIKNFEKQDVRVKHLKSSKYSKLTKNLYNNDVKKSNIHFDFAKNGNTKLEEYKKLKEKLDKMDLNKNNKSMSIIEEKEMTYQEKLLDKINKLLQNIVLSLKIKSEPIVIKIHDHDHNENLALKYENQEIAIEIDLAFKEITSIKALGLEIQSRESLLALKKLTEALMRSAQEIKSYHENPYDDEDDEDDALLLKKS
jgi:hypothetical protein